MNDERVAPCPHKECGNSLVLCQHEFALGALTPSELQWVTAHVVRDEFRFALSYSAMHDKTPPRFRGYDISSPRFVQSVGKLRSEEKERRDRAHRKRHAAIERVFSIVQKTYAEYKGDVQLSSADVYFRDIGNDAFRDKVIEALVNAGLQDHEMLIVFEFKLGVGVKYDPNAAVMMHATQQNFRRSDHCTLCFGENYIHHDRSGERVPRVCAHMVLW